MDKRTRTKALLGMLGLIAAVWTTSVMAEAAIYKWVDKNGEVHFTQTPPPKSQAQQIKPDYATPSTESAAPSEEAKKPQAKKSESEQKITVFNKAQAKKACEAARKQLQLLRNPKNQLMVQDANGKYHPMSQDELQKRIKKVEEIENKACVD